MRQSVVVGEPGWDNEAWQQIPDYERFWAPFDERFEFRPGMPPETWPAIKEPAGSVTFDLTPLLDRGNGLVLEEKLTSQVLAAMLETSLPQDAWVALDWQHPSYWFWPHRQIVEMAPWRITPFPDGDYYIFLTDDLEQGTFGHPWELTLCVFGSAFRDALVPLLAAWLPVKRTASP